MIDHEKVIILHHPAGNSATTEVLRIGKQESQGHRKCEDRSTGQSDAIAGFQDGGRGR